MMEDGIIFIMRGHQTYTLASILNSTQIQPRLYQQILHEIKSPLEQVSLDITQDNSFEAEVPRRPNIPPAPPKSPLGKLAEVNFSRTHESASISLGRTPVKETFHDDVMESVLSPLDQQISLKEEPSGPAIFCGGLMESILRDDNSFEIQLPPPNKATRRRPIFQGSRAPKRQKSIIEVVDILVEMGEVRLAVFLRFLNDLQGEVRRVRQERQELKKYMEVIYQKYADSIDFIRDQREESLSTYRLLRRTNSSNTCELLTRLLKEKNPARTAMADMRLQAVLASLSRLEAIIAGFMGRDDAIDVLETVHASLEDHYPQQRTLINQIGRLCESFGCQPNLEGFQLVWRQGDRKRVSRSEFVEGVSMNDCIVRLPKSFQEQLEMKGFKRNQ